MSRKTKPPPSIHIAGARCPIFFSSLSPLESNSPTVQRAKNLSTTLPEPYQNASVGSVDGRYPVINATAIDSTELAAVAAWHVLQGLLSGLGQLDPNETAKEFNLRTDSYGGHYGLTFFKFFSE
ncbi:MAG: hypothetical protein M1814_006400 [Vezdaea aestivalis]|nr:MAG: hypothetical protein M1814_006400 [Vezdaea aestivalis]